MPVHHYCLAHFYTRDLTLKEAHCAESPLFSVSNVPLVTNCHGNQENFCNLDWCGSLSPETAVIIFHVILHDVNTVRTQQDSACSPNTEHRNQF